MGIKLATLITITLLSSCSAKVISQNAIAAALQDIMSPANTDKALQIINMATTRPDKRNPIPDIARAVFASSDCLPARIANEFPVRSVVARNEMPLPGRIIVNEMGLPRAIITNDGVARVISGEPMGPEIGYPVQRNVIRQAVREAPANLIDSLIMPKEIYQSVPVAQESVVYPYNTQAPAINPYLPVAAPASSQYLPAAASAPNPYLPAAAPAPNPYFNPFLPAASPLSAMSPSCFPPPVQSKGQFLRKIPIPPPTL